MAWRLAVDIGGTFTDVVALEEESGEVYLTKVPSTPDDPSRGFISGIDHITDVGDVLPADVGAVFHGTTVATNAILQRRYSQIGLITTKGYREALEVARQTVPGEFGDITWWVKPERVVPLELVREVSGRVAVDGSEMTPIDRDEVHLLAHEFKRLGVTAIAVSLLHSYRDPSHEQQVRSFIQEVYPDCFISISSDILREYREYERTNTTCLNTALMPLLSNYHEKLARELSDKKITAPFYIMRSSGGLAQAEEISRQPITAALSGPAAGVIAACHFGGLSGYKDLICFDVGGTSADICLVEEGQPRMLTEGRVDIYDVKTPMIDMHTVGAGGGSIAWLAGGRSLKVGPESAGAMPGPACYSRGGEQATVSDANLILGRLPDKLIGGAMSLDIAKAETAILPIAERLEFSIERTAHGIIGIVVSNMVRAIRAVSIERGHDPRDFSLMAFGGAGALHAADVAKELDMSEIIVPPSPGILCAQGLVVSDLKEDFVVTRRVPYNRNTIQNIQKDLKGLVSRAEQWFQEEGIMGEDRTTRISFDMRYVRQNFELTIPWIELSGPPILDYSSSLEVLTERFYEQHEKTYGHFTEKDPIEIVNIRLMALGRPSVEMDIVNGEQINNLPYPISERPVWFESDKTAKTPVYSRSDLGSGHALVGPVIIEQLDTVTVIFPGDEVKVDGSGNLIIKVKQ